MEPLEAHKEELTAFLTDTDDAVPLLHPNMSEIYRKRLDRLYELLNCDSARGQAAEVLRSMIQSICLSRRTANSQSRSSVILRVCGPLLA